MTATIKWPTHCPHGTARKHGEFVYVGYADGCWTTATRPGQTRLFHCDRNAVVSITPPIYLRDWEDALVLNAGDDLYDRAVMLNQIHDDLARFVEPVIVTMVLDICGWCGGLERLNPTTNACEACHPDALDHMDYRGEVPWTDRIGD